MKQIRWAMVGSGFMAELIIHDFALAENTRLVAMVTRDPAATRSKLTEWGVEAQTIGSLEAAAASPDIDLVYIATPHSEHYWMAKLALQAGKHVLVEKPFAMNQAQAIELRDLAAARGLFLMEAMWSKFNPLLNKLKQIVDAGAIGQLKMIEANFGFNLPWWDRLFGTYRAQPRAGHKDMTIGIHGFTNHREVTFLGGLLTLPFKGRVTDYVINRRSFDSDE